MCLVKARQASTVCIRPILTFLFPESTNNLKTRPLWLVKSLSSFSFDNIEVVIVVI